MNQSPDEILQIIAENISSNYENITGLRKDFEELYLKFNSNQEFYVEKQIIGDIEGFKINSGQNNHDKIILFFHGGNFIAGSTKDHLNLCGKLSNLSGVPVLSIDYSLAPEYEFPAAVEDCVISYLWLLKQGFNPSKIVIAGISSGGTLALSTLLSLRGNGVELPAAAVCMSPPIDMLFQGQSVFLNRGKDWLTPGELEDIREIYLNGEDPRNILASPLYAELNGLPPILLQAGSHELLLDDIIKFHKKAKDSNVEVTFELWKDMFHCFQMFSSNIDEGQRAIENAGIYIKEKLSI